MVDIDSITKYTYQSQQHSPGGQITTKAKVKHPLQMPSSLSNPVYNQLPFDAKVTKEEPDGTVLEQISDYCWCKY